MTNLNLEDFRKPIIHENDENFNYNDGLNINYNRIPLFYKDIHFTGSTIHQDGESYRVIEYVNGLMEGKNCLFSNNLLLSEVFYDYGYETHGKTWYENGHQESVWERYTAKTWDEKGSLIYEKYVDPDTEASEEFFYFTDGGLKFKQFTNLQICVKEYYAPNQEHLLTQKIYFHTSPITDEVVYNHEALEKWYFDVLDYESQSLDMEHFPKDVSYRMHLIWMWFWEVLKKDKDLFINILYRLLQHPQKSVVNSCVQIVAYHRFLEPIQTLYHQVSGDNDSLNTLFDEIKKQQSLMDTNNPDRKMKTL